jgi:cyclopropane fatty-acyl-phospholipid synthase-like methyltransferase
MLPSSSFYNTIAHEYANYCEASHVNDLLHEDIALLENYKPQSVLELGVGDGRFAREYIKRNPGILYVGVDNSTDMIALAKDSGASLVLEDFTHFVKKLATKKIRYDCIIAPYTAIHHIKTNEQLELFENMKQITNVIIINCVTEKEETKIFDYSNETEITFMLPGGNEVKTVIHKLHDTIRKYSQKKSESSGREIIVWENTK